MRWLTQGLSIVLLLVLAGCATQADLEVIQRDNDELKSRLFKMEKDLGGMRNEAKESIGSALKDVQQERESARKGLADMQASMDSMKVDMQVISGKVDDLTLASKKPADEISLLREDMERRLSALDERIVKTEKSIDELQKKMAADAAKLKESEKQTPEALYQKGLDTYKSGNFQGAREIFAKFLELNPKHDLAANARYWTGETYFSEKKYEQAILEFQEVIKNFPRKEKVPAAMYKQAVAFNEIGDTKSARFVFKKLMDEFPASEEAKRAKEKLKELK